jgi:hypothetical protein
MIFEIHSDDDPEEMSNDGHGCFSRIQIFRHNAVPLIGIGSTGGLDGNRLKNTIYTSSGLSPVRFAIRANILRTKLLIIMKDKHKIWPAGTGKCSMRIGLSLDDPAVAKKCGQNTSGTRAWPLVHTAAKEILTRSVPASPCSRRSATTRSARA